MKQQVYHSIKSISSQRIQNHKSIRFLSSNNISFGEQHSSLKNHHSSLSPIPFIEHYRARWPKPAISSSVDEIVLPKRTVPDDVIEFEMTATMDQGSALYYPHLEFHPADFKVTLKVSIDKIGLSDNEKKIFCEMVGDRFRSGSRQVKITWNQFPNRLENKKYLIYVLENLIAETKRIYSNIESSQLDYDE